MSFGSGDETSSGSVNIGIYEETSTKGIPMLPDHIMDNFSPCIGHDDIRRRIARSKHEGVSDGFHLSRGLDAVILRSLYRRVLLDASTQVW